MHESNVHHIKPICQMLMRRKFLKCLNILCCPFYLLGSGRFHHQLYKMCMLYNPCKGYSGDMGAFLQTLYSNTRFCTKAMQHQIEKCQAGMHTFFQQTTVLSHALVREVLQLNRRNNSTVSSCLTWRLTNEFSDAGMMKFLVQLVIQKDL